MTKVEIAEVKRHDMKAKSMSSVKSISKISQSRANMTSTSQRMILDCCHRSLTYFEGVSSSSMAAVTNRREGKWSNNTLIPCCAARMLMKIIFSSATPASFIASMAAQAEPPVASIGSRMKTANESLANVT